MNLSTFHSLLSPIGQEILQAAEAASPSEPDFLLQYQSLSKDYPPELARAALETAILRREARNKFPFADKLYLTRQALEQASSYEISSYRAERYRQFGSVIDLGCSIGADSISLAKITSALGLDIDPLRLLMASANLQALGLPAQLAQANLLAPLPLQHGASALFFDPARRAGGKRIFSVRQYQPPLSILEDWLPYYPSLGVKISPGVNLAELAGYDAEVEFISLHGELKEAVLWFGSLKTTYRRATVLPGGHQFVAHSPEQATSVPVNLSEPISFLYEPDPAVMRAGLVKSLAQSLNASQLDPDIAYLTTHTLTPTPFARAWAIKDWFPFQLKRLRAYLRQHHIGRVTVKKRGSPLEPVSLIRSLRLQGDQECILVLTHLRGEPIVIVCNGL